MTWHPMSWIVLIPLLPLAAAVARSPRASIPAFTAAFLLTAAAAVEVALHGPIRLDLYPFIDAGRLSVTIGVYLDALTALVLLLVTGVSALVHHFASRYMQGDPRYGRFFGVTSLFGFAMIMLVMSPNLLMLYFFWEAMGLCSYLLISHQAERPAAASAATRVFLINSIADLGLGLAVFLSFVTFGTLDIQGILSAAPGAVGQHVNLLGWAGLEWPVQTVTMIALLFFAGAMGKSAQFPLHVWLPFAMEAPTPVSALIHAATLVKAGVFLIVRMSPLVTLSPVAMIVIMVTGGITALLGAAIALTQNDIKRILAYSTMSQLGLMMMTCGAGAFIAAVFHLLAHGVVKAFLFLSSGGALRQLAHHPQVPSAEPVPARPFPASGTAGALLLAWLLPPLVVASGYQLLWASSPLFWLVALGTILLTAAYVAHGFALISGLRNLLPLLLTGLTAALGLTGLLALVWGRFYDFLLPAVSPGPFVQTIVGERNPILVFLAAGTGVATLGWALGSRLIRRPATVPAHLNEARKTFYLFVRNKFYLDEIYDRFVLRPVLGLVLWLWRVVEVGLIERAITGCGNGIIALSRWLWLSVDVRVLGAAVQGTGRLTIGAAHWLWRSVDIRALGWAVDGPARLTLRVAQWLWRSVDIRGLEWLAAKIGRQNEATGEVLREIEPSMLQHQLLVMIFTLVALMTLFLIFFA
jgi:NADH-quinone oxidoreductase subunit L